MREGLFGFARTAGMSFPRSWELGSDILIKLFTLDF